jgi:hypothetical protein
VDQDPEREPERDLRGHGGEPAAVQEREVAAVRPLAAFRGIRGIRRLATDDEELRGELRLKGTWFKSRFGLTDK